ncbi:hypothetical protein FocTR4_00006100, partial [Fusarium oxysporum f. sp. cubense]
QWAGWRGRVLAAIIVKPKSGPSLRLRWSNKHEVFGGRREDAEDGAVGTSAGATITKKRARVPTVQQSPRCEPLLPCNASTEAQSGTSDSCSGSYQPVQDDSSLVSGTGGLAEANPIQGEVCGSWEMDLSTDTNWFDEEISAFMPQSLFNDDFSLSAFSWDQHPEMLEQILTNAQLSTMVSNHLSQGIPTRDSPACHKFPTDPAVIAQREPATEPAETATSAAIISEPEPEPQATQEQAPESDVEEVPTMLNGQRDIHVNDKSSKQLMNKSLRDTSSILVEAYFRDTAQIMSLYDSDMNPFKTTVANVWSFSEPIYYALQSMAAISLADIYPNMATVAKDLRAMATVSIKPDMAMAIDEKSLLALLMVGGTASWFNSRDTGASYFNVFRSNYNRMTATGQLTSNGHNSLFFQEALICWEMLLSFVVDDNKLDGPLSLASNLASEDHLTVFPRRHVPHPWTGIARNVQILLTRVGRLVRKNRRRAYSRSFTTQATIKELQREAEEAIELEETLFNIRFAEETEIADTGDQKTPTWHLLLLANVYSRVGLLQLYRVFPDVLQARLHVSGVDLPAWPEDSIGAQTGINTGAATDIIRMTMAERGTEAPHEEANRLGELEEFAPAVCNAWLTKYALNTIDMLISLPADSGTRDFQPFLLVACCSELRCPGLSDPKEGKEATHLSPEAFFSSQAVGVASGRRFILNRLQSLLQFLPGGPVRECINIVRTTWERLDAWPKEADHKSSYWMDVMIQKGWDTLMA